MPSHNVETWDSRFHWGILRTLGNSRLVTSSIVWLFVVPIAAKLLAPFAGQHTLDLSWVDADPNDPITFTIALPFSWQRFYIMSWLFLIGQVVYWFACPEIVRKYPNFGAYRADHASAGKLQDFIRVVTSKREGRVLERIAEPTNAWGQQPITAPFETPETRTRLSNRLHHRLHGAGEHEGRWQNHVFDVILAAEQGAKRCWFWVSGALFAGGLVLFAWVMVEGVVAVCKLL